MSENKAGISQSAKKTIEELGKVNFPTKPELIQSAMVVVGMMMVFAVILGGIDLVLGKVMQAIIA